MSRKAQASAAPAVTLESAPWSELVLICRECAEKRPGGTDSKGRTRLRDELRTALKRRGLRKRGVQVVDSECLDLCPKRGAIAVARGGELAPGASRLCVHAIDDSVEALADWLSGSG